MRSLLDAYWNEIRGRFERLPVWLPGTPMDLGDVGTFTNRGWTKITTLAALGVSVRSDPSSHLGDVDYASRDGVEVTAGVEHAGVDTSVAALAGDVTYRFQRTGAFVLRFRNGIVHRLADLDATHKAILALYKNKAWKRDWVVVAEVLTAAPTLVLVANQQGAEAAVRILAKAGPASTKVASAAPLFTLSLHHGLAAALVDDSISAIMWRGYHVRDPLLQSASIRERGHSETTIVQSDEAAAYVDEIELLEDLIPEEAAE